MVYLLLGALSMTAILVNTLVLQFKRMFMVLFKSSVVACRFNVDMYH